MIASLLQGLRQNRDFMAQVAAWERQPARPARFAPFPEQLSPQLENMLQQTGMSQLFTHQTAAVNSALSGQNVVMATRTASGKSLGYLLPVFHACLQHPNHRALFLFPTKALAQDQLAKSRALIAAGNLPITINPYDGDTSRHKRSKIRKDSQIILSNPDMLHAGILPFHPQWRPLLENLKYVVIDEIHAYRGIFGSHVANVLRRLHRLCHFYGSQPQFICTSATIANPLEHAERLVEKPFTLIDESANGAPQGEQQFILFNPPLIDEQLGLRQSTILVAKDAAATFIQNEVQTAIFTRTRQTVELLLGYLQDELTYQDKNPDLVGGYRGGYLPLERRRIEEALRSGELRGVVATNALELGVDIGALDAVILTGYPGSIASVWQQAGRAGRRAGISAALMITSNSPLDQYIANHPRYLFGQSPESALINPDNLRILVKHLACAAFELPFSVDEQFGSVAEIDELLEAMTDMGMLHRSGQRFHWLGDGDLPARSVSLRTSGNETVVIQTAQTAETNPLTVGEIDLESAAFTVYEGAVYMHQGNSYVVDRFDWEERLAIVQPELLDYYTRATVNSDIRELLPEEEDHSDPRLLRAYGDVMVVNKASGYRKIKRYSHETLGFGDIDLPPWTLDTSGYWTIFGEALAEELYEAGILLRPNDYGPTWSVQRQKALVRDGNRCRMCGASGEETTLHVHHIRPFREYGYRPGHNRHDLLANEVENLLTVCPSCHRQAEQGQQARSALGGLAYVLRNLAPLFLMCDPGDIEVTADSRSPLTKAPTLVIYEQVAAGVGFSQHLFEIHDELMQAAADQIAACRCAQGCPACVGPPGEIGPDTKGITLKLVRKLLPQAR